ncbi:MAG: glycosyltransferase family 39 protein [Chloroflexi bacterium]|nr:glycosyltransferase family 39 protein [Chloroflexota bacterium]
MTTTQPACPTFPRHHLLAILLLALLARVLLLASGSVSFHADEAVVALMARHILQGARPVFFYGQAYMGSLDAWLVAIGFRLLGESVLTVRVVQSALYLLVVATGYLVAWRLSERRIVATAAGLALAVPTVNVALYTTATLGGYNEVLLLGHLVLLFGYEVSHERPRSIWRWALLGLCAGLGWWTHGLIAVYAVPVAVMILYRVVRLPIGTRSIVSLHIVVALIAFIIGSAPWWIFDLQTGGAAISTFLTNRQTGTFAGIGLPYVPPPQRALGLLVVGLPALIGLRVPWSAAYFLPAIGALVALVYAVALYRLARVYNPLKPDARALIFGMLGLFLLLFVASSFGADPTGRYFLPLALPLGIVLGMLIDGLYVGARHAVPLRRLPVLPVALVALVIGYHAAGQIVAATMPPGFTTQFDPVSHIPNDYDTDLIAFLDANNLHHGYTTYWIAFRLAFLSSERLQYSSALPYKADLSYNAADNRYRPYADATDRADQAAYITANVPALNQRLESAFAAQGLRYRQERIGPFTVYYAFEPHKPTPLSFTPP